MTPFLMQAPERNASTVVTSVSAASRRSRYVLMSIQVFSLLIATMVFNTARSNWTDERIRTTRLARLLLRDCPPQVEGIPIGDESVVECYANDWISKWRKTSSITVDAVSDEDLKKAALHALGRGYTSDDVRDKLSSLERFRLANLTTVKVPIIGVRIDVNGLGIFGGLGLSILLLWLGLSIGRERLALRLLGESDDSDALQAIRMETLFFPHERGDSAGLGPWLDEFIRAIPVIAFYVPVALLLIQWLNDYATRGMGMVISAGLTAFTLWIEGACWLWTALLAIWCNREYTRLMKQWDRLVGSKVAES